MATLHLPNLHRSGRDHHRLEAVRAALWRVAGVAVLLYIVVFAVADIDPWDTDAATIAVIVLATAWSAHAWHRLWAEERRAP